MHVAMSPHALLRRYEKCCSSKYTKFVECLGEMALQCEGTNDDFLKEWINRVDCGGLFPLNDVTYIFSYL